MSDYDQQQIVFIKQDLTGISSFSKQVSLNFTPRWMKVKFIAYRYLGTDAGAEAALYFVRMRSINKIIGTFGDSMTIPHDTLYDVDGATVVGAQTFEILDVDDALDATRDGVLSVCLEFIR